ncbi:hypothetical protein LJR225_001465 [Phenylobacterium sp. LjRoot225]|uniref:hypothetical protein n=1 Tax=Phenylobacterium sp. LjRoot225 TaxID=3342285 RepID=UPI003ED023A3
MRARDVRAIAFCIATTAGLLAAAVVITQSLLAGLVLTAAYDAWLLSRPRMVRLFRRLRGDPGWDAYFDNGTSRVRRPREPGRGAPSPRPAERP